MSKKDRNRVNSGKDIEAEKYSSSCRVQEVIKGKVFECITDIPSCRYLIYYGNAKYCTHLLNKEIAKNTNQKVNPSN